MIVIIIVYLFFRIFAAGKYHLEVNLTINFLTKTNFIPSDTTTKVN